MQYAFLLDTALNHFRNTSAVGMVSPCSISWSSANSVSSSNWSLSLAAMTSCLLIWSVYAWLYVFLATVLQLWLGEVLYAAKMLKKLVDILFLALLLTWDHQPLWSCSKWQRHLAAYHFLMLICKSLGQQSASSKSSLLSVRATRPVTACGKQSYWFSMAAKDLQRYQLGV